MNRDAVPLLPRQQDEDIIIHREEFSEGELKKIIRALNLKVTTQRLAILKALHEGRRHVTEGKFVSEVRMGGLPARYELNSKSHHDHLTCVRCGKICEFENKTIETLQEKVAKQFGFHLTHHVLELYGVCPTCQTTKTK